MILLAASLASLFAALAALHAYWGCGGRWAAAAAAPKKTDGSAVFRPSPLACFVVAAGLAGFAWICLAHVNQTPALFLQGRTKAALLVMSGIFALRTIGDSNYVGLFRRVRGTDFARLDRLLYTPLCLMLSAGLAWLALQGGTR